MLVRERIVADTNVIVSRLLLPGSVAGRAVCRALERGVILLSEETLNELAEVLGRPKFDRYVTVSDRQQFLRLLGRVAEFAIVTSKLGACRDPKDDKFLELAIDGRADLILTGDRDLLALHPFEKIAILSPADYLAYS